MQTWGVKLSPGYKRAGKPHILQVEPLGTAAKQIHNNSKRTPREQSNKQTNKQTNNDDNDGDDDNDDCDDDDDEHDNDDDDDDDDDDNDDDELFTAYSFKQKWVFICEKLKLRLKIELKYS